MTRIYDPGITENSDKTLCPLRRVQDGEQSYHLEKGKQKRLG